MNEGPIRALFVVPDLRVGGAERQVTTLLPRMDPARFTPSVVCIGEEGGLFNALPAAGVQARALHLSGKRNAVYALRELISITRQARPDVVVMVASYNAETLGRIAARVTGVKHSIVWVHNASNIEPRSFVRNTIDRALTRWTSCYFGVSEAQRRYLVSELGYPANSIRIIHNGVDPALFDADTDRGALAEFCFADDDPVVGILGALRPEKDHATLLRAARIVINEIPQTRLLIIGDGATRAQLVALCSELRITPNVRFAGNRSDIGRLLCAIDVFALSSTTECFPMALLEAMACARPAVCTAVGGVPEIISHGETGYLVPPKDPERLAAALLRLLSDPQTARRMGRAGRDCVEAEFNLERSVSATEQAIEAVVSGGAVAGERAIE